MRSQIDYIEPSVLKDLSAESSDFTTNKLAINNNFSISIWLSVSVATGLKCRAFIEASINMTDWYELQDTSSFIVDADDINWTLSNLESVKYVRVSCNVREGSAIFYCEARAV